MFTNFLKILLFVSLGFASLFSPPQGKTLTSFFSVGLLVVNFLSVMEESLLSILIV